MELHYIILISRRCPRPASSAVLPPALRALRPDVSTLPPPSAGLVDAASGGISVAALLHAAQAGASGSLTGSAAAASSGPPLLSIAGVKARLSRNRDDEAAFPRRLMVSRGRQAVYGEGG